MRNKIDASAECGAGLPAMTEEQQHIYDATPPAQPLSRLEKHKELILRWHRDGRSCKAICELLKSQCGVQITKEPLRQYIKRRTPRPLAATE